MDTHDPAPGDQPHDGDPGLDGFFDALRASFPASEIPPVGAALSEFVDPHLGLAPDTADVGSPADAAEIDLRREPVPTLHSPARTRPMLTSITTFAGTLLGKLAIGTSVAVAAAGGAHATGVVDVPILPDVDKTEVVATESVDPTPDSSAEPLASPSPEPSPSPQASPSPDASPSPEPSSDSTPASDGTPVGATSTHAVLDAGAVTIAIDGANVTVVSADPAAGWAAEIETDEPHEAEVNFRNGGDRVDFRAEIEDGQLRIRIRDRRTDTET